MTYIEFKNWVKQECLTLSQLRCDNAPPTSSMLEVMDCLGLAVYERFVSRLSREVK